MKLLALTILCIVAATAHAKSTFIRHGHDSEIVPYYAYLEIFNQSNTDYLHFGGGTLISTTLVLTVAQNIDGFYKWKVGLGANRIADMQWFESEDAVVHPGYSSRYLTDNVGIIRLTQPVTISNNIRIAFLVPPSSIFPEEHEVLTMFGFGFFTHETVTKDHQPDVLQRADILVNSQLYCRDRYPHLYNTHHIDNFFCANNTLQSNICAGDQGGPVSDPVTKLVVGIQSFYRVEDCTDENALPGAFIRTARYANWFNDMFREAYDLDSSESIFDQYNHIHN